MPKKIAAANKVVEAVEAPAPKKHGRKPGSKNKPKPDAPKKATKARKTTSHKATEPVVVLQYAGMEVQTDALVKKALEAYRAEHPRGPIFNTTVYVKPEENMVYYVINKAKGEFPIE